MTRPIVLVTRPFLMAQREAWDDGYDLTGPEAVSAGVPSLIARIEVIVTDGDSLDLHLVDALPNLRLVACFSTGYAGIDLGRLRARGITLTTAAAVNAHDVADHAIALTLAWWHGIPTADRTVRSGQWRNSLPPRPSLRGRRIGIVGLGRIGLEIAHRAAALDLKVNWWGPREKPSVRYTRAPDLMALARDSDILVVAMRATPANAGAISREVLAQLGPKGLLVNVSRGFLVDEPALIRALESGTLAGAALDVFAEEPTDARVWARFDNVLLTPHIAGYTQEAGTALFAQLRENLRRYFAGLPLMTPVEDPL